jgi:hypothetical protein
VSAASCSPSTATWAICVVAIAAVTIAAGLGAWRETIPRGGTADRLLMVGVRCLLFGGIVLALVFVVTVLAGAS